MCISSLKPGISFISSLKGVVSLHAALPKTSGSKHICSIEHCSYPMLSLGSSLSEQSSLISQKRRACLQSLLSSIILTTGLWEDDRELGKMHQSKPLPIPVFLHDCSHETALKLFLINSRAITRVCDLSSFSEKNPNTLLMPFIASQIECCMLK